MVLGVHDVLFPTVHVSPPSSFSNHSQSTCSVHTDCVNCQSAVQIRHAHPDIPTSSSTIGILHMIGSNTFWFDSILLPHFSPLHATYATISPSFYHTFWYIIILSPTHQTCISSRQNNITLIDTTVSSSQHFPTSPYSWILTHVACR